MVRQECMPPQQISPSATTNSPWSAAMSPASRKVSAMRVELAFGVLVPGLDGGGGVDADAAGRADAELAHLPADLGGLADLGEELLALVGGAHGGAAAGAAPDRGDEGADLEAVAGDVVGHALDGVEVAVDVEVGGDDEEVDAVELLAVGLGVGGERRAGCRGG